MRDLSCKATVDFQRLYSNKIILPFGEFLHIIFFFPKDYVKLQIDKHRLRMLRVSAHVRRTAGSSASHVPFRKWALQNYTVWGMMLETVFLFHHLIYILFNSYWIHWVIQNHALLFHPSYSSRPIPCLNRQFVVWRERKEGEGEVNTDWEGGRRGADGGKVKTVELSLPPRSAPAVEVYRPVCTGTCERPDFITCTWQNETSARAFVFSFICLPTFLSD